MASLFRDNRCFKLLWIRREIDNFPLRECVTRFLTSLFFHDSNPSGPLINRAKYFRIRFWFRQDIRIVKKLHGVHHTAELDSAVCILPRSQTPWCASHRRVMKTKYLKKLCSVHSASHPRVKNFKVSVLIVSFKIVISLWCLKILLWQQYCKSQMEWNGAELSALFGADLNKDERCMG